MSLSGHHTPNGTIYDEPKLCTLEQLPPTTHLLSPHAPDLQAALNISTLQWHTVQPNAAHIATLLPSLTPTPHSEVQVLYLRTP
ncbi:MAG TPA: hypothetical protein PLO43_03840 [Chlamydiales bacterium]|nr:hypothetical protein [Chlamydiales bacterium]